MKILQVILFKCIFDQMHAVIFVGNDPNFGVYQGKCGAQDLIWFNHWYTEK